MYQIWVLIKSRCWGVMMMIMLRRCVFHNTPVLVFFLVWGMPTTEEVDHGTERDDTVASM